MSDAPERKRSNRNLQRIDYAVLNSTGQHILKTDASDTSDASQDKSLLDCASTLPESL